MKNTLVTQLQKVLPAGMELPAEMVLLYDWIEANGLYVDRPDGYRIGFLYPEKELKESWDDDGRAGGTTIEIAPGDPENFKYWFGGEPGPEVKDNLCVFAQSGADGSEAAFWRTPAGDLKIVHMGSGSGSMLNCVLAHNAVDFIRLLAIGYDEICWSEAFPYPPNEEPGNDFVVQPNGAFQEWVTSTFGVTIPKTALEIVAFPAGMDDAESEDAFFNWCRRFIK
jgi:hypothetical protein